MLKIGLRLGVSFFTHSRLLLSWIKNTLRSPIESSFLAQTQAILLDQAYESSSLSSPQPAINVTALKRRNYLVSRLPRQSAVNKRDLISYSCVSNGLYDLYKGCLSWSHFRHTG
jgi:hypothetical protein